MIEIYKNFSHLFAAALEFVVICLPKERGRSLSDWLQSKRHYHAQQP